METGRDVRHLDKATRRMLEMEDALGIHGLDIYDGADLAEDIDHRHRIFGFDDEVGEGRVLADMATEILAAAAQAEDNDVGVVVTVMSKSDMLDYGSMIEDMRSARNASELMAILESYRGIPYAEELAAVYAEKMPGGVELRLVV